MSTDVGPEVVGDAWRPAAVSQVTVDIAVPVYNEEQALPGCVQALHDFLRDGFPFPWTITVVDNGSTDGTRRVADELAARWPRVRALHEDRKGKGLAVRTAWLRSEADVVAYMDVDLSTGLDALLPLVASLAGGHSDLAIGSRFAPGARVVRGTRRELASRAYNGVVRRTHGARFTDAQCGFKAARAEVVRPLLRHVEDDAWFFDTELLLLAEHNALRLHEVAVDWVEDTDTRVAVGAVAAVNLRGLLRILRAKRSGAATVQGLPRRPPPRRGHPDADPARLRGARLWFPPRRAQAPGPTASPTPVPPPTVAARPAWPTALAALALPAAAALYLRNRLRGRRRPALA